MFHRLLHDPIVPADTEGDDAGELAEDIARAKHRLAIARVLVQMSLEQTEAEHEAALEARRNPKADAEGSAPKDPGEAWDRRAKALRRSLALEVYLEKDLRTVRAGEKKERAERTERRAADRKAHEEARKEAVIHGLHDAYAADCSDDEYHNLSDRLLDDAREYLDADEMRGWLDRPVGETVARLAAAIGLDPTACEPDPADPTGRTWRVRRPILDFEMRLVERAQTYGAQPRPLPPINSSA